MKSNKIKIVKNRTDVPDQKILNYIEFCKPFEINKLKVVIHKAKQYSHGLSNKTNKQIDVWMVDGNTKYPQIRDYGNLRKKIELYYDKYNKVTKKWQTMKHWHNVPTGKRNGYLPILLLNRDEDLIHIIAHELRHQWQYRKPFKSQYVYAARRKTSDYSYETDCDAYAIKKIREWRRVHADYDKALKLGSVFWNNHDPLNIGSVPVKSKVKLPARVAR